ncbi:MAG: NERD domain-containing protein [Atopobiaceae bacterium]|jgi:hypothetical protein|nr:NERD domain-containing protein [Atopobiaceae bacterium]MCH4181344.1 NERD domain-containing protein [Atopobiaceae bacterium]MCH4213501.1 NERD domain-containing protein [Atopobiaceae bacterium]MCH4229723.1 NERD domain-containing protein [Atopobiaceae bacterium]MCH4276148.1 NERD domain-containing protein [Atopobiaceae bacterium]
MSLFSHPEPVFAKEGSSATDELAQMQALLPRIAPSDRWRLERDIHIKKAGIDGEDEITFQLRNSHLPIYVIHDLNLEHGDLSSQIDFLVIAPYVNVVIECKKLTGNITVDDQGQFIRNFDRDHRHVREGIESPISQNKRHLELLRSIRLSEKGTIGRIAFDHWFDDLYDSVVVLANDRTVLNDRYAPREIKDQIIRADTLIDYLGRANEAGKKAGNGRSSDKDMREEAERWLTHDIPSNRNVTSGYQLADAAGVAQTNMPATSGSVAVAEGVPLCPDCGAPMVRRTAKKGPHAGEPFWGCSRWPDCKGIVDIVK